MVERVEQVEPGGQSPAQEPDGQPREPGTDQPESAPGRRARAWTLTVAGAWSAMAVVGLTIGRPELAMVTHIAVRAVSGSPISGAVVPVLAVPAANPSPAPKPAGGQPSSVQEGVRRGSAARVTYPAAAKAAASGGQPPAATSTSPPPSSAPSPTGQPTYGQPSPSPGPTPSSSSPASSPSATASASPSSPAPTDTATSTPTDSASPVATDSANCLQSASSSPSVSSLITSLLDCPSSLLGPP
jgi:hypothetical protein